MTRRSSAGPRSGASSRGGGPPRVAATILAAILLAVAATVLRPPAAAGPFARDFEAYYAAGAAWNDGGDPWTREVWATERTIAGVDASRDELLPFVGPAAALPLFGALARRSHQLAVRIWTGLQVGAILALLAASLRLARGRGARIAVSVVMLAAAAAPITSALALGQAALIGAAGIACALVAFESRSVAGGALATLAAAIQPNLALVLVARLRDRVAWIGTAIAIAAFAAMTVAAGGGFAGIPSYLRVLGEHGRAERFDLIQITPAALAWSFGATADHAATAGIIASLVAIAAIIIVTIRWRLDARDGTLLALAALPFAVPFFHEHDFAIELVPLTILAVTSRDTTRAIAGIACGLVLTGWLDLAQRPPAQPALLLQALAVTCAFAGLGGSARLRRADLAAPLSVIVAAMLAMPLAHAFPAPTWPDALPAHYHAAASMSAGAVWADEQRATGLLAQIPAWGALRAFPLAGCIILAVAIVRARRR